MKSISCRYLFTNKIAVTFAKHIFIEHIFGKTNAINILNLWDISPKLITKNKWRRGREQLIKSSLKSNNWIMKKGIKLILKEGTTFDLYFLDGVVKRYDILSLADKFPQLKKLENRELFMLGKLLGWGGVVWNDELDVSIETVYEEGIDVTNEYSDIDNVLLGYKIKQKRIESRLSQQELAEKIGIDQSDLSKIEKGSANPSIKMLSRIATGLNCKLSIIIE